MYSACTHTRARAHAYIARTQQTEHSDVIGTATAGCTISEHSSIPRGISHLPRSSGIPFFHSGRLLPRPRLHRPRREKRDISYSLACAPRATPRFQSKALPMRARLAYFFSKGCPLRLFYGDTVSSSTFAKCSVNNTEAFFPSERCQPITDHIRGIITKRRALRFFA